MIVPLAMALVAVAAQAAPPSGTPIRKLADAGNGRAHPPIPAGSIGEWFGAEAYPPEAMRANEQGRVGVKLNVDARGKPAACVVAVSSGSFSLDSATCSIAMEHLTFTPAADDRGEPTAGVFSFATRWVIPRAAAEPAGQATPLPVSREP